MTSHIRGFLQAQISKDSFLKLWSGTPAAYQEFLDDAARRLANRLPDRVDDLQVKMCASGPRRMRLDGTVLSDNQTIAFYAEIVWLPSFKTFRGNVSVRNVRAQPPPKTVDEFISGLDSISDERETIFVGQVFNAMEGLDENDPGICRAYPAIFRLFERFPEEDFGNPGHLVHLMVMRRGYDALLAESLRRAPSIPALELACELAFNSPALSVRKYWLDEIRRIAGSKTYPKLVSGHAECLLK